MSNKLDVRRRCIGTDCTNEGTRCVWSPTFADFAAGPMWLCEGHFGDHEQRAISSGWFCDQEAVREFSSMASIHRDDDSRSYDRAVMEAFRSGVCVGGDPLGKILGPEDKAYYALHGVLVVVTDAAIWRLASPMSLLVQRRLQFPAKISFRESRVRRLGRVL